MRFSLIERRRAQKKDEKKKKKKTKKIKAKKGKENVCGKMDRQKITTLKKKNNNYNKK